MIAFGVALALRFAFQIFPDFFETAYFRGAFPLIRKALHPVSQVLPFSGYYLVVGIAISWFVWRFPRKPRIGKNRLLFGRRLLNFCGGFAAAFLVLWGYLYVGPGLAERMEIEKSDKTYDVAQLYLKTMEEASLHRRSISLPHDSASVEDLTGEGMDSLIYESMSRFLEPMGYVVRPEVTVRRVKPIGTLRRLGISGIYNPFTSEANVESSQGAITGSFTTAHEMAHAMGITGEGEANFAAYLGLGQSDDPILRYAASFLLWRYVASEVPKKLSLEDQERLASLVPEELMIDRVAIWNRASRYKAYFPEISERMNDQYLKIQGVRAGAEDYNSFVTLYLNYIESFKE